MIWQCNSKFKNGEKCCTPHLYEDTIKQEFVDCFNRLMNSKAEIVQGYETIILTLTDSTELDKESANLQSKTLVVTELLRKCIEENANATLDQAKYNERYSALVECYETAKNGLAEVNNKQLERTVKQKNIEVFMCNLKIRDGFIEEFSEELWNGTVEKIFVQSEREMLFEFKDGLELNYTI